MAFIGLVGETAPTDSVWTGLNLARRSGSAMKPTSDDTTLKTILAHSMGRKCQLIYHCYDLIILSHYHWRTRLLNKSLIPGNSVNQLNSLSRFSVRCASHGGRIPTIHNLCRCSLPKVDGIATSLVSGLRIHTHRALLGE